MIYIILGWNKIKKSDMNYLISGWLKTVFFYPPARSQFKTWETTGESTAQEIGTLAGLMRCASTPTTRLLTFNFPIIKIKRYDWPMVLAYVSSNYCVCQQCTGLMVDLTVSSRRSGSLEDFFPMGIESPVVFWPECSFLQNVSQHPWLVWHGPYVLPFLCGQVGLWCAQEAQKNAGWEKKGLGGERRTLPLVS